MMRQQASKFLYATVLKTENFSKEDVTYYLRLSEEEEEAGNTVDYFSDFVEETLWSDFKAFITLWRLLDGE